MPRLFTLLARPLLVLGLLALAACETRPPENRFPEITFRHLPPLRLAVSDVVVEQEYQASAQPPNVEYLFPVQPGDAAARWAQDRLVAAGSAGRARYIVREAAVTETALKTKTGVTGALTVDQSERYDGIIRVELQILGADGRTGGTAKASVERSITVPEDITLLEREKRWFKMVEDMMRELNAQLQETITSVFARYLAT